MEEKIWAQICRKANTSVKDLTPNARGFLRRRTKQWLGTRKITSEDVDKAAADLARRYPDAVSGTPSPGVEHMTKKSAPNYFAPTTASNANASFPSPVRTRSVTGHVNGKRANSSMDGPKSGKFQNLPQRRAQTPVAAGGETNQSAAIPSGSGNNGLGFDANNAPTRPAVVQRMLKMASNQKWQDAIEKQVQAYEEEEKSKLDQRRAIKSQMQKDMQEAERYRLMRAEEVRKEREENAKMVYEVMKDVEAEEKLKITARREKEIRERADMEAQRLEKLQRDEERKAKVKQENLRIRKEIKEDIELYEEEQLAQKQNFKHALLDFLSHSEKIARERKEAQARVVAEQRKRDKENASKMSASEQNNLLSQKQYQMQMKVVQDRRKLQDKVGQIYLEEEEHRAIERQAQERKTQTAMELRHEQIEARNQADKEKKLAMRAKLVESLDTEIRIHEERKREQEADKSIQRQRVDEDTVKFHAEKGKVAVNQRQKQLKLCQELDEQISNRFQDKLKPMRLKVTEKEEYRLKYA